MPKPVCVPCGLFYRPEKNGYIVEEGMPHGIRDEHGKFTEPWSSYKLWVGDKWKCHGCGNEIVVGFAGNPISEHYMGDYEALRKQLIDAGQLTTFIEDC